MAKAKTAKVPNIPRSEKYQVTFPTPKPDISKTDKKTAAKMEAALNKGVQSGIKRVETSLSKALDKAMTSSTWEWSSIVTYRQNGQTPTSPRNIVDTGFLRDSKSQKIVTKKYGAAIEGVYKAPYASTVHYGGMIRPYGVQGRQLVSLPPRKWVEAVLYGGWGIEKLDVSSIIDDAVQKAWSKAFSS